ncbi:MAG: SDR family NAD(P)-dependent oxidoreductase [Clostridiales bacterium]|nr:SDR family NAD(P)-dependent oxidoreductase [Clostridiales bacterium]
MTELEGKTAFVTGAASGLGLGIAKAFAKEGMNVVIADFRQTALDEALSVFRENGWAAHAILLDVTDRVAFEKAADEAEAVFGKIHILVNNAGIGHREGNIWETSYEDMDFFIDINYKSILNGIKTIVPRILKHGEGGHVVSTASKNGLIPVPGMVLYNSTKRAVMAIMETLAIDLEGTGVGASVFCPGPYQTNLGQSTNALREKQLGAPFTQPDTSKLKITIDFDPSVDFAKMERSPDEAGERVVRGIKRSDLFILTHSEWKPGWEAHAAAVTRAFPDEEPDKDFMKVFKLHIGNPIYDKQTQVPGYKK